MEQNDWLAHFLYKLSHDLIAPARNVRGFNELVIGKLENAENIPQDVLKCARLAAQESERMYKMVEATLQLGRIQGGELTIQSVPLKKLLNTLWLSTFQQEYQDTKPAIQCEDTLAIQVDIDHARTVFTHLIENACLYCTQTPTITITASQQTDHALITIQDQGIGLAPKDFDKACALFSRFNPREHKTHIGAGLCIVQSILARYNSELRCEPCEQGTRVSFTLPTV